MGEGEKGMIGFSKTLTKSVVICGVQTLAQLSCRWFLALHKSAIAKIKVGVSTAINVFTDVGAIGKLDPLYLIKTEIPAERIKTLSRKFA
jgi:hypothetical protein